MKVDIFGHLALVDPVQVISLWVHLHSDRSRFGGVLEFTGHISSGTVGNVVELRNGDAYCMLHLKHFETLLR